jgi:hypothetical protein
MKVFSRRKKMIKTVKIEHSQFLGNFIKCPDCEATVKLLQNTSVGASYAKTWTELPDSHIIFLGLWRKIVGQGLEAPENEWITKQELFDKVSTHEDFQNSALGGFKNRVPFNGRISELVGAGTAFGEPLVSKSSQLKSGSHTTIRGPFYRLNIQRVDTVLKHGGILNETKTKEEL